MIDDLTQRIHAARSQTWIDALQIGARLVRRTIGINDALRSAASQWVTIVALETNTGQDAVLLTTLSIRSASNCITGF